tara:strand:+ start:465 stop:866 length:402 start_codon:yes stop_codon:yes gene_type:complete
MELKSLLTDTKKITADFPGAKGFKVTLAYLSKEKLRKISEKSKTYDFDPDTRKPVQAIDDELFSKLYIEQAILGWEGLKYEYLTKLVLVDGELPEGELEFSLENASTLVNNSPTFDRWVSSVASDISLFNKGS